MVLCDFFSDSEGDGSPNPELLVLPNVNTGVNIEALFASSPGTQKSDTSIVSIDPSLSDAKFKVEPHATSKSMFEISNIENCCFVEVWHIGVFECLKHGIV